MNSYNKITNTVFDIHDIIFHDTNELIVDMEKAPFVSFGIVWLSKKMKAEGRDGSAETKNYLGCKFWNFETTR